MNTQTLEQAMARALELALLGPVTGINPQVGAVILDAEGAIVAEGYHRGSGTPHAEVMALEDLKAKIGSPFPADFTAVVTLEPCNHTGKTGPCSQALIEAGISTVVFAASDPGQLSGGGADTLRSAGVNVLSGILGDEAEEQARVWLTANKLGRPFVTVKWASTLDGRAAAANGTSQWITGEEARRDVHARRATSDAILVGTGTVIADNPSLTARNPDGSALETQPLRVVLGESEIPFNANVLDDRAETLHIRTRSLSKALSQLWGLGIKHVFVEGGPKVASAFIADGLVDEFLIYLAPKLLGGPKLAVTDIGIDDISEVMNLNVIEQKQLGDDIFIRARRA